MTASAPDFRTVVARVRDFVPGSLLDARGWRRIADRVGDLPGLPAAYRAGFEFRLSDPEPAADFIVALGRGGELFSHYLRSGQGAVPRSPAASLGRLLGRMERPQPDLKWLRGVMLEYDVAKVASGSCFPPGVFLGVRSGCRAGAELGGGTAGETPADTLAETLSAAVGWDPDPEEVRGLARVVDSVPPKADLIQVGAMPGRSARALRTTVIFAVAQEIPAFLENIGWPGPVAEVDSVCRRIAAAASCVLAASLGVGRGGVQRRLGLEIYLRKGRDVLGNWTKTRRDDWCPVLEWMEAEGWCLPRKARALRELPGLHLIAGRSGTGFLYFGLNHLKLGFAGARVSSKGYAGMRFSPPAPAPGPGR